MLDEREAFLRAIFDAPADARPKLIFADWLEERGEEAFARMLRFCCEWRRNKADGVKERATRAVFNFRFEFPGPPGRFEAFFSSNPTGGVIEVSAELLADCDAFRKKAAEEMPEWYAATILRITSGQIINEHPFTTLFHHAACSRVSVLHLTGRYDYEYSLDDPDYYLRPVITQSGIEALAVCRAARRLKELDLTDNDLGNDALRILAKSPYLNQLTRLNIARGNNFRDRVWQLLVERFGENVVS